MLDYSSTKTSIQIEEQLPLFIRKEGPTFIDFLTTYYDWLERRIVLLNLKAKNAITPDQLTTSQVLSSESFTLATEDESLIITEDEDDITVFNNNYSLAFNGVDQYMTVSNTVINTANSWSVGLWLHIDNYPSVLVQDADILSLSNATNFALIKVSKKDNQIHSTIGTTDIDTGIDLRTGEWNYLSIRYNSTSQTLYYDLFNYRGQTSFANTVSLPTANRLGLAYNAYSTDNFYNGKIDQVSAWNSYLSNNEIVSIYNDGTPINTRLNQGNYTSNSHITNVWLFETANTSVALNEVNPGNNGTLIHNPTYVFDIPINVKVLITEYEETLRLLINTLSYIPYSGGIEGVVSTRMLLFAEHIYGKLENDTVLVATPDNTIIIDSFIEAKNPLNVINNLDNYQDIDYSFNYNNFISNEYFQYMLKEIMVQFPLFLHPALDYSIKDIIAKNIKDFYESKGTLLSIKYLFKILFNEDLIEGTTLYSDAAYSYVIKTKYATSAETLDLVKKLVHPIGYNVTITSP